MKLAVKDSLYLFRPMKVVAFRYLVTSIILVLGLINTLKRHFVAINSCISGEVGAFKVPVMQRPLDNYSSMQNWLCFVKD